MGPKTRTSILFTTHLNTQCFLQLLDKNITDYNLKLPAFTLVSLHDDQRILQSPHKKQALVQQLDM
jgi:hypothetical protein